MFFVLKKGQLLLFVLLTLLIAAALVVSLAEGDAAADRAREYLISLGYTPSEAPSEALDVCVPQTLDRVYDAYNALQKEAGFDLVPFCGQTLRRYSFTLGDGDRRIANILMKGQTVCGGDICDPASDGYMLPLLPH